MPPSPIDASPVGLGVQAGLGAIQTTIGLINAAKEKREAAYLNSIRPVRTIDKSVGEDVSLAESDLAKGMSSRAETAYNQANDKALSTSLDAILKGGGSVNNVSDVFANSEEGRTRLATIQDQLRLNQINNVFKTNATKRDELDKNFLYNEVDKWKDSAQANAQARQQSQNQIWSGLNSIGAGAINFAGSKDNANAFNSYLKTLYPSQTDSFSGLGSSGGGINPEGSDLSTLLSGG